MRGINQTKNIGLILLCLITFLSFSQNEKNIWYFGQAAGLNFSSGNPVSINGGQTSQNSSQQAEGTAIAADSATGALMFYTDGTTIWNKNHQVMQNGNGLKGDKSSTQSALIVPMPGNKNRYYIFTTPAECGEWDLVNSVSTPGLTPSGFSVPATYSVVDITQAGGLGAVVTKNVSLFSVADEKLTAIPHCNGKDWWIIFRKYASNQFYVYPLTSAGVGAVVISSVGTATQFANTTSTLGAMKATSDGKKIAIATCQAPQTMQLFDFCRATGKLSNPIIDNVFGGSSYPYGVSFSPDDSKLYITTWGGNTALANSQLFQYDLSSGTSAAIIASKTQITTAVPGGTGRLHALLQAPNGKIYIARETPNLDVINNPNALGAACGYATAAVNLAPNKASFGLPNFIETKVKADPKPDIDLGPDITKCNGPVVLDAGVILGGCGTSTYLWSTGATTQTITVNTSGTYWVKNTACYVVGDTIEVTIGAPKTKLPADTSLCGGSVTLDAGAVTGASYSWSTGATTQTIQASTSGNYIVEVSLNGCSAKDTVTITIGSLAINAGPDVSACAGPVTLDAGTSGATYTWSTGATTQTINVSNSGTYTVQVTKGGCSDKDTVLVSIGALVLDLGKDITICNGTSKVLTAPVANGTYTWSTGATTQSITVTTSGTYWVKANQGNCTASDTIQVSFNQINVDLGNDTTFCTGTVQLDASNAGSDFIWSTGATSQTITVGNSGTYWVSVEQNGCRDRDTIKILTATPEAPLYDIELCEQTDAVLDAQNPGATYLWNTGETTQTIAIADTGIYWVKISYGNCELFDSAKVEGSVGMSAVFVPNAFTPGKNGINDVFYAVSLDVTEFELTIFNRWGEKIYYSNNPYKGWDGTVNGNPAQQDVYVWVVDYKTSCPDNRYARKIGHVSLLR